VRRTFRRFDRAAVARRRGRTFARKRRNRKRGGPDTRRAGAAKGVRLRACRAAMGQFHAESSPVFLVTLAVGQKLTVVRSVNTATGPALGARAGFQNT
jgi:hypothetical protein